MNLSNNLLRDIPIELADACPNLELINLNNNPLIPELFEQHVDQLARLTHLKSVFLTLTEEEQVDLILRKIPNLQSLNGLAVDREELYNGEEEEEEEEDDEEEQREVHHESKQDVMDMW